jgi:gluconokinase
MTHRQGHFMPPSLLGSQLATFEALEADEPGFAVSADSTPDRIVDEIAARLGIASSP